MNAENDAPDPVAELKNLLAKEDLETRFHRLLISIFRRICDGGYFPAQDFLDHVEQRGGVAFARDWLNDDRAQPALDLLCSRHRVEFAIEWLVWQTPYRELFSDDHRDIADRHLRSVSGHPGALYRTIHEGTPSEDGLVMLPPWTSTHFARWSEEPETEAEREALAVEHLKNDSTYTAEDLELLQKRRFQEYHSLPLDEQLARLERELQRGYPFSSSADIWAYAIHQRERAAGMVPLVTSWVTALYNNSSAWMGPAIRVLRPALDLSNEKAVSVSKVIRRSQSESAQILAWRAALACCRLSRFARTFVSLYFAGAEARPYYLPECFTSLFVVPDAQLLNVASIVSHLLPSDHIRLYVDDIVSFGDLPEVSIRDVVLARPFSDADLRAFEECLREDPRVDADLEDVILFVHLQVIMAQQISKKVMIEDRSPARTADVPAKSVDSIDVETTTAESELLMRISGPERASEAERRVRVDMGSLFDLLCPRAKTALKGAEYTLMDGWHPAPSQAVISISVAFENQMKESFLRALADYVHELGERTFPKDESKAIVRDGRVLEKPLEQILRALRLRDALWDDFAKSRGFNLEDVRRALESIKDVRNEAAHKGGMAYEDVQQYRRLWLDPRRGIFAALVPTPPG